MTYSISRHTVFRKLHSVHHPVVLDTQSQAVKLTIMTTTRGNQKKVQQQQKDMEYQEKLKLLDEELMSFYQYCQQVGFSEAEMDMIVAPLVATLRKSLMKKLAKVLGAVLTILALCYCAAQLGSVSMHFAALGRLFMIKVSTQFEILTFIQLTHRILLITHSPASNVFVAQLSFPSVFLGCLPLCPSLANLLDECGRNLVLKGCRKTDT